MNLWQRWKKVSINNKLMIYMTAILAVATTLYTLMYRSQVEFTKENARQSAEQTDRLVAASERLAETTKSTLDEAKRVNKEAADRADRTLQAIETQTAASKSQAKTSQISARAAEESAQIAREGSRPAITSSVRLSELTDDRAQFTIKIENNGNTRTQFTLKYCALMVEMMAVRDFSLSDCNQSQMLTKGPFDLPAHNFKEITNRLERKEDLKLIRRKERYFVLPIAIYSKDIRPTGVLPMCGVYREEYGIIGECSDLKPK